MSVRIRQRIGDVPQEDQRVAQRKASTRLEPRLKSLTLDERHHVVQQAVDLTGVDQPHDVGVTQPGGDLYLPFETISAPQRGDFWIEDLEYDRAGVLPLLGQKYGGRPAAAQLPLDDISVCQKISYPIGQVGNVGGLGPGGGREVQDTTRRLVRIQHALNLIPESGIIGTGLGEPGAPFGAGTLQRAVEQARDSGPARFRCHH